jgi:class 3 adenylate cyclase/pimeloyl-ACP methyl ester carboxylesterase
MRDPVEFGYARPSDGAYIGYRVDGDGPIDIVHQPDWPGNIDLDWENPLSRTWLEGLVSFGRVIMHDHRGVGLSSRDVPPPTLETRVADLLCVLEKVEVHQPVLAGFLSSGAVNVLAAATNPGLARAIVWAEPWARYAWAEDYPWGTSWEALDDELGHLSTWGTVEYGSWFLQDQAATGNTQSDASPQDTARQSRNACTPEVARELSKMWFETDVRGILASVQTPTLLLVHGGRPESAKHAEYLVGLMPNAELAIMPGEAWTERELPAWHDEIRRFIGVERPATGLDTILSSVLFTDLVDSTAHQATLGDRAWKDLIERHHGLVRAALERWHGVEIDTAGDGFYATFDGPARAVRCAQEIVERVRTLGIELRAGVHTGECHVIDGKLGGIAVTIGARIMATSGASEIRVSQTVRDLVAGSGLSFEDAGEHELKGVPDRWRLYRVLD